MDAAVWSSSSPTWTVPLPSHRIKCDPGPPKLTPVISLIGEDGEEVPTLWVFPIFHKNWENTVNSTLYCSSIQHTCHPNQTTSALCSACPVVMHLWELRAWCMVLPYMFFQDVHTPFLGFLKTMLFAWIFCTLVTHSLFFVKLWILWHEWGTQDYGRIWGSHKFRFWHHHTPWVCSQCRGHLLCDAWGFSGHLKQQYSADKQNVLAWTSQTEIPLLAYLSCSLLFFWSQCLTSLQK